MIYNKKTQTSVEMLVILAVVIVLTMVVVISMDGFRGSTGQNQKRVNDIALSQAEIPILDYVLFTENVTLFVGNNLQSPIIIDAIYIDSILCDNISGNIIPHGQFAEISCNYMSLTEGFDYQKQISLNYTSVSSNATFSVNYDSLYLIGTVVG
ncbi:MAG: hypothetical protein ACMXYK_01645 [Candidatus Woesearchaeota archaeon]